MKHLVEDQRVLKFKDHLVPVGAGSIGEQYLWLYHSNEIMNDDWDFSISPPSFSFKYEEDKVKFILKWG